MSRVLPPIVVNDVRYSVLRLDGSESNVRSFYEASPATYSASTVATRSKPLSAAPQPVGRLDICEGQSTGELRERALARRRISVLPRCSRT
jgi:hypothetical protein